MIRGSIRNKLIVLLLVITIVPFGSSIIITYFHTKDSLQQQAIQETSNLLHQGKYNLENYMNALNRITLNIYNNQDFMNYVRYRYNDNSYLKVDSIKSVVQNLLYADEYIQKVQIALVEADGIISTTKQTSVVFSEKADKDNEQFYLKAKNSPFNKYIEIGNGITVHHAFLNLPSDDVLAYISLDISPEKINLLSENLYNPDTEEFYILSAEGDLIYSSSPEISRTNQDEQQWIAILLQTQQEKGQLEWKEGSFSGVMIYDQLPQSAGGWFLVKRIPNSVLYESALSVAKMNILLGIIGLVLVILATLLVSLKITSPIRILVQNIHEIEKGNMKVQFESLGSDEIGILGARFKQMVERLNQLINREYKLELENKTNQLKVLHSQINPHFLYNALQSIGTVALKNKVPQIYTLVTHLSKIMRYSIDMEEDTVPLMKEINYTKAFLLLQKERFGDHLDYSIDVDVEAMDVVVPKMILQPVIENYFKHGFDSRDSVGEIKLECKKIDHMLQIKIRDNGIGITEDRLKEVYQYLQQERQSKNMEGTNIGLKNIYSRLMLYYNELATLHLENNEEGGLLVTISLPIDMDGEEG